MFLKSFGIQFINKMYPCIDCVYIDDKSLSRKLFNLSIIQMFEIKLLSQSKIVVVFCLIICWFQTNLPFFGAFGT